MDSRTSLAGFVDAVDVCIQGWIWDAMQPTNRLSVCGLIDGERTGDVALAALPRGDVAAAGHGDGCYGFNLPIPPQLLDGREHVVDVAIEGHDQFSFPRFPGRFVLGEVSVQIRPAQLDDMSAYATFWTDHLASVGLSTEHSSQVASSHIRGIATRKNSAVFVAFANGRVVGYCMLEGKTSKGYEHVAVLQIVVLSLYRGKGIGKALLTRTLGQARGCGLQRVELTVGTSNAPAISLYRRHGFKEEGRLRRAYFDGRNYTDELLMAWLPQG